MFGTASRFAAVQTWFVPSRSIRSKRRTVKQARSSEQVPTNLFLSFNCLFDLVFLVRRNKPEFNGVNGPVRPALYIHELTWYSRHKVKSKENAVRKRTWRRQKVPSSVVSGRPLLSRSERHSRRWLRPRFQPLPFTACPARLVVQRRPTHAHHHQ